MLLPYEVLQRNWLMHECWRRSTGREIVPYRTVVSLVKGNVRLSTQSCYSTVLKTRAERLPNHQLQRSLQ